MAEREKRIEVSEGSAGPVCERRKLRDAAQALLSCPLSMNREEAAELRARGIACPTEADALMLNILRRAVKGEMEALKFLRDMAGESNTAKGEVKRDEQEKGLEKLDLSAFSEGELLRMMGDG